MKKNKILHIFLVLVLGLLNKVNAQNQLYIPPVITSDSIVLTLQTSTYSFFQGQVTNTMGANGSILGPTILLNKGDSVRFWVNNLLPDTTTIHWHGMHVSSLNDGGPHTYILPGTTWNPAFTVRDKAGVYWYHPHLHKKTDIHVSKGIAGLILVKDTEEAQLNLPRTYGIDDIPLVIQTKAFDSAYQIMAHSNNDSVLMVNATIDPFIDVPAQVVRYRILNGSSQRVFNLGLSTNEAFYQIATDGGLLSSPNMTTRLQIAPGERVEILLDFTGRQGDTLYLKSYASELPNGIYGASAPGMNANMPLNNYNPNSLNGSDFNIIQFNVVSPSANTVTSIPSSLVNITPFDENSAIVTRTLTFTPVSMGFNQLNGNFLINNATFNMGVINYTIPLNNIEIWELTNQSAIAHPFHIHDVQFYILDRNGVAPGPHEQGRKDVVLVRPQETVRFITKFETFANDTVPYMYHCHMLPHEDGGMMGQFIVSNSVSDVKYIDNSKLNVYPNPSMSNVIISTQDKIRSVKIYNSTGAEVNVNFDINNNNAVISGLIPGLYLVSVETMNNAKFTRKLIVQ
jgi:bilirubin oxidase